MDRFCTVCGDTRGLVPFEGDFMCRGCESDCKPFSHEKPSTGPLPLSSVQSRLEWITGTSERMSRGD